MTPYAPLKYVEAAEFLSKYPKCKYREAENLDAVINSDNTTRYMVEDAKTIDENRQTDWDPLDGGRTSIILVARVVMGWSQIFKQ